MSDESFVSTEAVKAAVRGQARVVLQALGIPWTGKEQHIRCPSPNHEDQHPSWRWDQVKERAFCTCQEMNGADILAVVMTLEGEKFETAKVRVAEMIGRADLIRTKGRRRQSFSAENLLKTPSDKRDDTLPSNYLACRLRVGVHEVVSPTTRAVGWSSLSFYDPPATSGGTPDLVGEWPCAVFETIRADGKRHAHRIYVEPGGASKADLGVGRSPKKAAQGKNCAGCAVVWGDSENAHRFILCEGIETGAAIALSFKKEIAAGETAVASAISNAGVRAFQPWPGTQHITVAADRDDDKAPTDAGYRCGEQAAFKFAEKHASAIGVDIALPGDSGEKVDWLDVLLRVGADAVVDGIMNAEAYQPKTEPSQADAEAADTIDLDRARQRLADLAERAKHDAGAPFEADTLKMLAVVRGSDPPAYARLQADLKKVGVSMRDLNRELRKHSFRVIEGGAHGGDGATERAGPYKLVNGAICHEKDTKDGLVTAPLCNFDARIVGEEIRDDGAERVTVFAVEGRLQNGKPLPRAEVPADRYSSMNFVTTNWGTGPVIYAGFGAKDHLRAAVQMLSGDVPRRMVFAHLGWRKIVDEWFFPHSGGAIGPEGSNREILVSIGDSRLARYALAEPPVADELETAVRASLAVLDLAPAGITFPLVAAVYLAPLGETTVLDLSLFLAGPTGVQKTELAALAQAHYGAGFSGKCLPGNWSTTGNALEKQAFLAKDVLFVVDDFSPTGTSADVARLHRDADRLLRGQGNRAGRGRMHPDGTLRPEYYPRGIVVSTGEDIPRGQSLRSRTLILELSPGNVDLDRLMRAQDQASRGLFAGAMAGYVQYLAPRIDALKESAPPRHCELRAEARQRKVCHDRTPDLVASLMLGLETFLRFAVDVGVIDEHELSALHARGWETLLEAAEAQAGHQATEEPTGRFLALIASAIASGQAHVAGAATNEKPSDASNWGWRRRTYTTGSLDREEWQASGVRIGWIEGDDLYLDPDAAFAAAQRLARDQGASLTNGAQTLWKRMFEKGKLASRDEGRHRNKVRRVVAGCRRSVVHILADTLLCAESGPNGPIGQPTRESAALGAENVGRFPERDQKAAHETGPQAPENRSSGPDGSNGPEIEHRGQAGNESFSDGETEQSGLGEDLLELPRFLDRSLPPEDEDIERAAIHQFDGGGGDGGDHVVS